MRYWNSYFKMFEQSQWYMTLLWLALLPLAPIIGPMVVDGYLVDLLHRRFRYAAQPEPSFDINHFVDYLKLGLWPFLVRLVSVLVLMILMIPILAVSLAPLLLLLVNQEVLTIVAVVACSIVLALLGSLLLTLPMIPLVLRAAMLQNFGAAFHWSWSVDFLQRTWLSCLLTYLFLTLTFPLLMIAGYLCCFIGVYPAMAICSYGNWNLLSQLYGLYLQRGGQALPLPPIEPPASVAPGPALPTARPLN